MINQFNIVKNLPNIMTLLNLLAGCFAIFFILQDKFTYAIYCHFASLIFDFLDGFLARSLKSDSALGVQLDSLADMVSFGVAPATIAVKLLAFSENVDLNSLNLTESFSMLWVYVLAMSAGLRLGKFNIRTQTIKDFVGIPTPPMAMFFFGLLIIMQYGDMEMIMLLKHKWLIIFSVIYFTLMMNTNLIHFKLRPQKEFFTNPFVLAILGVSLALIIFNPVLVLSGSILAYTVLSIIANFVKI